MSENTAAQVAAPTPADLRIGIDIGGTGMKGGIVDTRTGELVGERFRIPTPQPATPEACAAVVRDIVDELQGREIAPEPTSSVGIDFPAIVKNGVTLSAANVDESWIGADLEGIMSEALGGRAVHALNDADAAGLAEAVFGQGKGKDGLIAVITLGTGIGSALIMKGQLIPNTELGHLEIDGHNAESRASARAREIHELSWKKYGKRLQRYFSHVEFLFSPDLFVIGGGISKNPEKFMPYFEDEIRTPMVMATLRNNAGIVGAALWATQQEK
ncbi:polyphosphate--glucose phosphotransferase [Rothia nasimurium]|uniref:polyphosphate--glucose phosphotransferase n=1 Tax=Rothia nasimurium TaxID=85336 RepID=UPI001F340A69|nr:ROK family protein [Rothia nasimurium]